ncbi:uncharacterized protein ARMOST_19853 [Armillaria ostoyae]|uniref:Uncharacterized protein n=1 Tax=Armillaria ostoyae TaxID=47428 RepID=A0A284S5Q0_ARMOS|nr:uncharacterized protein ARMOST_19853 [Armillaria ostoyae]
MTTSLRLLLWIFFGSQNSCHHGTAAFGIYYSFIGGAITPFGNTWQPPQGFPPSRFILLLRASPILSLRCEPQALGPTPFDLHIRNPPFNGSLLGHRRARCLPIKGVDISPTLTRSIFDHLLPYSIYPLALHHWRIDVLLAHKRRPGSSSLSPPPPSAAVVQGSTTMSFCLPTVRIIVTSNAERYQVVEITGATNGSSIRERILSKVVLAIKVSFENVNTSLLPQLCIPDDRYSRFRVYQAQVGTYAIGSALSDAMLFEICLQQGDPSGSLTFFVSTAPDRPPKTTEPDYSDTYLYSQS